MRRALLAACVIAGLCTLIPAWVLGVECRPCALRQQSRAARWQRIELLDGAASLEMPGRPRRFTDRRTGEIRYGLDDADREAVYLAEIRPLDADAPAVDELFADVTDEWAEDLDGDLQNDEFEVNLDGLPGLEVHLELPNGTAARVRMYRFPAHLVILVAMNPEARGNRDANRFLESLEIDDADALAVDEPEHDEDESPRTDEEDEEAETGELTEAIVRREIKRSELFRPYAGGTTDLEFHRIKLGSPRRPSQGYVEYRVEVELTVTYTHMDGSTMVEEKHQRYRFEYWEADEEWQLYFLENVADE